MAPDQPAVNPNDVVRQQILGYFYDRSQKARGKLGKYGYAATIKDVKADLKALYGLSQPQVVSNLEYLIDREWVRRVSETKEVKTKSGMVVPSTTTYFHISAEGTDKIEGGSEFKPERFAGINIEATGKNVITVGDGNYVDVAYQDVYAKLSELRELIVASPGVSEEDKFAAAIEIATVQDQLAKTEPDMTIAERVWPNIEKAASLAGLAGLALEVAKILGFG